MTWVKLDDQFPHHPKVLAAGPEAMWLYVGGLCYCASQLTDGRIPKAALPILTSVSRPEKKAQALVEAGLWVEYPDAYLVPNYLDFNPSKEQVESQRDAARDRQRKSRSRHGVTDSVTDAVTHGVSSRAPSRPQPEPQENPPCSPPDDDTSLVANPGDSVAESGTNGSYPATFEDTWAVYPRKTNKRGAFKAWHARVRSGVKPADLRDAVGHYAAHRAGQDDRFTLHGSTFFGPDERWRDFTSPESAKPPAKAESVQARRRRELLERVQADEAHAGRALEVG